MWKNVVNIFFTKTMESLTIIKVKVEQRTVCFHRYGQDTFKG